LSSTYPSLQEFFLIGKALKSHGTSGQLRLMIEDQFKGYIREGSFLFFELNGSKVPYRVVSKEDGAHFVVTLEDVPNKKESDVLSGLDLWIPLDAVKPRHQRSPRNIKDKWDDYSILDQESSSVYNIIRVEEYPQQLMAVIRIDNREILIPLSDQLISSIDKGSKTITMHIPEGLMDL
jgi:16S rRNA processing protein RimM